MSLCNFVARCPHQETRDLKTKASLFEGVCLTTFILGPGAENGGSELLAVTPSAGDNSGIIPESFRDNSETIPGPGLSAGRDPPQVQVQVGGLLRPSHPSLQKGPGAPNDIPKWIPGTGTCPTSPWDMHTLGQPNLSLGHTQPHPGTCPTSPWDMPNLTWGHAQPY